MNQDEIKKKILDFCMFYEPTAIIFCDQESGKELFYGVRRFVWTSENINYRHTRDAPFMIALWFNANERRRNNNCPEIILKTSEASRPTFQFSPENYEAITILDKWYISPIEAELKKILLSTPFQKIYES